MNFNKLRPDEVTPMQTREFEIALSAFENIRERFPALSMSVDLHPSYELVAMDIPAQPGLSFKVRLSLRNSNELYLVAADGYEWIWLPCSSPDQTERFMEAVCGLLSGEFRIVEHRRGRHPVKAQLQRPDGNGWKNVASFRDLLAIVPWPRKTFTIVQNKPRSF
jgi:hypothetical protein